MVDGILSRILGFVLIAFCAALGTSAQAACVLDSVKGDVRMAGPGETSAAAAPSRMRWSEERVTFMVWAGTIRSTTHDGKATAPSIHSASSSTTARVRLSDPCREGAARSEKHASVA